jgi:riboflavin kinase / FMN adenylyltransferase
VPHYHSLDDVSLDECWLTIGVFDGVHRGHQEILTGLAASARQAGLPAAALTFHPHPAAVLGRGTGLRYLTLPEERAALLADLGMDLVITLPFTRELADLTAETFMSRLRDRLGVSRLRVGYDFALGRDRKGDVPALTEIGRRLGYTVETVPAVTNGEQVVSSSLVRSRLAAGEVESAAAALGRPYALSGPVVRGDGRGRKIDIPTANLAVPPEKVVPANGVYACRAWLGGESHPAVTNVGVRPTFTPEQVTPAVEAHILDFDAEIYSRELRLEFVARLRDEMKFPGVQALVEQIRADISRARDLLR